MPAVDAPPFTLTGTVLWLVAEIAAEVGRLSALTSKGAVPLLRRDNRIRSIHASLAIENNTLSLEQVTAVIAGKRVLGPPREILEVKNAFSAYEALSSWQASSVKDLLAAHKLMLQGLVRDAGRFRSGAVGIAKGAQIVHLAPPAARVPGLMQDLHRWLKYTSTHPLVASCVFHYELEFIHPFSDGNGRLGRLWQTLILSRWNPLFADLPVETVIRDRQADYYRSLAGSDKAGNSTIFIEFLLSALLKALQEVVATDGGEQQCEQVGEQVLRMLQACSPSPRSKAELLAVAGLANAYLNYKRHILPLLQDGLLEWTVPDNPNSRRQKYRLTDKGRHLLR